jgi:hypothetical protein
MTTPEPQPRPAYVYTAGSWPLHRILLVVAFVLFVIGAFAASGDTLGSISAWTWGFGAFAAWVLSGAVP